MRKGAVYGFFRDEMQTPHNYYDVIRWLFILFAIDVFSCIIFDPVGLTDNYIFGDIVEGEDVICYLFISLLPLSSLLFYKIENGLAIVQAMFLYVMLLGWFPFFVFEMLTDDWMFILCLSTVFFDYIYMYDDEDVDFR
jgi:hypothetical protein